MGISLVALSHDLLDNAATVQPGHLPTSAAIHLASALTIKKDLTAFVCYDSALNAAAEAAGLPATTVDAARRRRRRPSPVGRAVRERDPGGAGTGRGMTTRPVRRRQWEGGVAAGLSRSRT